MQSNYASIKEKLGFAIKTANTMKKECGEFKAETEKLTQNTSKLTNKLKNTEEDNVILTFLLSRLKSVVVDRIPLEGVNLMNYNLEYLKYALKEHSEVNNRLENSSSGDNYQENDRR